MVLPTVPFPPSAMDAQHPTLANYPCAVPKYSKPAHPDSAILYRTELGNVQIAENTLSVYSADNDLPDGAALLPLHSDAYESNFHAAGDLAYTPLRSSMRQEVYPSEDLAPNAFEYENTPLCIASSSMLTLDMTAPSTFEPITYMYAKDSVSVDQYMWNNPYGIYCDPTVEISSDFLNQSYLNEADWLDSTAPADADAIGEISHWSYPNLYTSSVPVHPSLRQVEASDPASLATPDSLLDSPSSDDASCADSPHTPQFPTDRPLDTALVMAQPRPRPAAFSIAVCKLEEAADYHCDLSSLDHSDIYAAEGGSDDPVLQVSTSIDYDSNNPTAMTNTIPSAVPMPDIAHTQFSAGDVLAAATDPFMNFMMPGRPQAGGVTSLNPNYPPIFSQHSQHVLYPQQAYIVSEAESKHVCF